MSSHIINDGSDETDKINERTAYHDYLQLGHWVGEVVAVLLGHLVVSPQVVEAPVLLVSDQVHAAELLGGAVLVGLVAFHALMHFLQLLLGNIDPLLYAVLQDTVPPIGVPPGIQHLGAHVAYLGSKLLHAAVQALNLLH